MYKFEELCGNLTINAELEPDCKQTGEQFDQPAIMRSAGQAWPV